MSGPKLSWKKVASLVAVGAWAGFAVTSYVQKLNGDVYDPQNPYPYYRKQFIRAFENAGRGVQQTSQLQMMEPVEKTSLKADEPALSIRQRYSRYRKWMEGVQQGLKQPAPAQMDKPECELRNIEAKLFHIEDMSFRQFDRDVMNDKRWGPYLRTTDELAVDTQAYSDYLNRLNKACYK